MILIHPSYSWSTYVNYLRYYVFMFQRKTLFSVCSNYFSKYQESSNRHQMKWGREALMGSFHYQWEHLVPRLREVATQLQFTLSILLPDSAWTNKNPTVKMQRGEPKQRPVSTVWIYVLFLSCVNLSAQVTERPKTCTKHLVRYIFSGCFHTNLIFSGPGKKNGTLVMACVTASGPCVCVLCVFSLTLSPETMQQPGPASEQATSREGYVCLCVFSASFLWNLFSLTVCSQLH